MNLLKIGNALRNNFLFQHFHAIVSMHSDIVAENKNAIPIRPQQSTEKCLENRILNYYFRKYAPVYYM